MSDRHEVTVEIIVEVPTHWRGEDILNEIDYVINEMEDTKLRFVGGRWD